MPGEIPERVDIVQQACGHSEIRVTVQQAAPGSVKSWRQCVHCGIRFVPESRALAAEAKLAKAERDFDAEAYRVARLEDAMDDQHAATDRLHNENTALRAKLAEVENGVFLALHPECWARPGVRNSCTVEMCDCFDSDKLPEQVAQLRADLRALEPLARRFWQPHRRITQEEIVAASTVLDRLDREGT